MAYTTSTEVQGDFKNITFGASDNVKATDVDGFITEADALIDSYVGTVYVVPVTAGGGLNLLKLLSRSLVVIRIKRLMKVKQEAAKDTNQNIIDTLLSTKDVMDILKNIQSKKATLEGATPLDSSGGFSSFNVKNSIEPVIKKDSRQW